MRFYLERAAQQRRATASPNAILNNMRCGKRSMLSLAGTAQMITVKLLHHALEAWMIA
jgi:hypothetical protein